MVLGLVVVASLIRDAMLMGILPHRKVIAPLARASIAAVNDILN